MSQFRPMKILTPINLKLLLEILLEEDYGVTVDVFNLVAIHIVVIYGDVW